ncbi:MAG: hypothetical protein GY933_00445, partial [Hyphomicrobiales bacterium]|nr:hypothetical protein [Hyphomicrobiales bacterium]
MAALAANSQVMGKKRPEGMSKAWQDLGQTYLNATIGRDHEDYKTQGGDYKKDQKGKKTSKKFAFEGSFRNITKLWSGIGSAILAPLGIARLATAHGQNKRAKAVFRQQFQSDVGRSPHPSALKYRSASELREMAGIGKDRSYKAAQHEVTDILKAKDRARKDNSSMAGRIGSKDVLTGSPNLKVQFARHLQEEFAPETLMGYDWVEKSTSHIKADD